MMVSPSSASAKTAPAKVVSYSKVSSSKRYHALYGNIYSNAKLTKKVHNASNFPNTVFSVTKSATIKKQHGVKSIYYYISNNSKTVKGWIWRGNLSAVKTYSQEKSDINAMIDIINTMDPDDRADFLVKMDDVTPRRAYSGISNVTKDMSSYMEYGPDDLDSEYEDLDASSINEMNTIGKIYNLFETRFTSAQKRILNPLYDNYTKELKSAISSKNDDNDDIDDSTDVFDTTYDFATILAKDIGSLQK